MKKNIKHKCKYWNFVLEDIIRENTSINTMMTNKEWQIQESDLENAFQLLVKDKKWFIQGNNLIWTGNNNGEKWIFSWRNL